MDASKVKGLAFKGGKALFIRHLAGFLINFSGGIFLARSLGPEILGLYFISFTVFMILRQLIDFGVGIHLIRLPSMPDEGEIKGAFTLQQAIALACALVTLAAVSPFAAYWYGHKGLFPLIASAGIGAYFNSLQSIPLALLERKMEYRKVGFIEISEIAAFNLAAVAGAVAGAGVMGLALGNILRGAVPAFISAFMTGTWPSFSTDRAKVAGLVRTASPLVGANLVLWVIILAPPVLIGSLAGTKELGIAQMAYGLLGNTMFIATIFQRLSLTSLSKFQDDMERFNRLVQNALKLLFVIYIPFTMSIASLSPWWVPLIYGERWSGMSGVMIIASVPFTASALISILPAALLSKGHASTVLRYSAAHAMIYWAVMGLTASYLGAVSMPVSHMFAMLAGYMLIKVYSRSCGEIDYKPLALGFCGAAAVAAFSWLLAKRGMVVAPVLLWSFFIAFFAVLSSSARQTVAVFIKNMREI